MVCMAIDLGSGQWCRGDVCVDINFSFRNPYDQPWLFDNILGGKTRINDKVVADLNYPLPFRDNAFCKAIMRAVLEHLYRPLDALLEARRILKQGASIHIVVPNCKQSNADFLDETHIISFTEVTIKRLVSMAFKVESVKLLFNKESIYVIGRK